MIDSPNAFGFDVNNFSGFMNPEPVYDAILRAAGIWSGILPLIIFLVFLIRYFGVAASNLTGKARVQEAIGGLLAKTIQSFAYSFGGFLILYFLIALSSYFYSYGSFTIIAEEFSNLIQDLKSSQKEYDADFITHFLDFLSLGSAPVSYIFFFITSSLFVLVHTILRFSFAVYFGIMYLWGFIAIPSGALEKLSFEAGWIRGLSVLFIWPATEATFYLFLKFCIAQISTDSISIYGQTTFAQFNFMHGAMGTICLMLIILELAAPYMAARFASNQEALTGLVTPAMLAAAYVHNKMTSQSKNLVGGLAPNATGERHRDKLFSGLNEHPIQSAKGAGKSAINTIKGLGNAITQTNSSSK